MYSSSVTKIIKIDLLFHCYGYFSIEICQGIVKTSPIAIKKKHYIKNNFKKSVTNKSVKYIYVQNAITNYFDFFKKSNKLHENLCNMPWT